VGEHCRYLTTSVRQAVPHACNNALDIFEPHGEPFKQFINSTSLMAIIYLIKKIWH